MRPEDRVIIRLLETFQLPATRRMVLARCDDATLHRLHAHFASYEPQFLDGAINCRLIEERIGAANQPAVATAVLAEALP